MTKSANMRASLIPYPVIAAAVGGNPEADYYGAAEPPVRCGESHLSGLTEPPVDNYSA